MVNVLVVEQVLDVVADLARQGRNDPRQAHCSCVSTCQTVRSDFLTVLRIQMVACLFCTDGQGKYRGVMRSRAGHHNTHAKVGDTFLAKVRTVCLDMLLLQFYFAPEGFAAPFSRIAVDVMAVPKIVGSSVIVSCPKCPPPKLFRLKTIFKAPYECLTLVTQIEEMSVLQCCVVSQALARPRFVKHFCSLQGHDSRSDTYVSMSPCPMVSTNARSGTRPLQACGR